MIENRNVERVIVILFSIYHLTAILGLRFKGIAFGDWNIIVMLFMFGSMWVIFFTKVVSAHFRFVWYFVLVMLVLGMYSITAQSYSSIFLELAALITLMGLFGFIECTYFAVGFILFLTVHHCFIQPTIDFGARGGWHELMMPLVNILMIDGAVMFWLKKRMESSRSIRQMIGQLKSTEKTKDDFMANVSHEIRTPINTISGLSEQIIDDRNKKDIYEDLRTIRAAGHSLMGVVTDMLDFADLQSGTLKLVEEPYNVEDLISDITEQCVQLNDQGELDILIDVDQNIPKVLKGDDRKIRRVVMNLVSNAFKFTKEGGIRVVFGYRYESYGVNLVIAVRDTGIGMSEENVANLFSTYNQVDSGRARQEGGVGLGLSIAYAMVAALGGVITIDSTPGKGTRMQVTIPQKVVDERPVFHLDNPAKYNVLIFFNMEQSQSQLSELRDAYREMVTRIAKQLHIRYHFCRNIGEVKRRLENEAYTHLFIAYQNYMANEEYFERISGQIIMTVLMNQNERSLLKNPKVIAIEKPMHVAHAIRVLQEGRNYYRNEEGAHKRFTTKDVHALVVDDNEMNLQVMKGFLSNYRIQVTTAMSGYEAIEHIYDHNFDFVFMDHMMPNMDGIETLQHIRGKGDRYCTRLPILAVTANAVSGAKEMFLEAGFDGFLEKPVERNALERVLLNTISGDKLILLDEESAPETGEPELPEEKAAVPRTEEQGLHQLLDVAQGELYCGSTEQYMAVLREVVQKGARNWRALEEAYASEDWKNYVIQVHGIKSTMKTIGAMPVSEQALKLEQSGKAGEYAYIRNHHEALIQALVKLMEQLHAELVPEKDRENPPAAEEPAADLPKESKPLLPELTEEGFDRILGEYEEAVFAFDETRMLGVLSQLEAYSYGGRNLSEELSVIRHKVEMSDYMSSQDALEGLRKSHKS